MSVQVVVGFATYFVMYMLIKPDGKQSSLVAVGIMACMLGTYIVLGKYRVHDFGMFPDELQCALLSFFRPALPTAREEVERLLADGADIGFRRLNGSTALHDACNSAALLTFVVDAGLVWGHDATVEKLLDLGAAVNVCRKDGATPLHLAAGLGRCAVVQQLLDKGADVHLKSANGRTPLHSACEWAHASTVQKLLDNGALVNLGAEFGDTPLHGAAGKVASPVVVHLLLDRGAEVHARNSSGETPEDLAFRYNLSYRGRIVGLLRAEATRRAKCEAFCMGQHLRLGAKSLALYLDADVVRMILDQACARTETATWYPSSGE